MKFGTTLVFLLSLLKTAVEVEAARCRNIEVSWWTCHTRQEVVFDYGDPQYTPTSVNGGHPYEQVWYPWSYVTVASCDSGKRLNAAYCCGCTFDGQTGGIYDIFDAGWGTCDSYAAGVLNDAYAENHRYCLDDYDGELTGHNGNKHAWKVCSDECNFKDGTLCPEFESYWGVCSTYAPGKKNHDYCGEDTDIYCKGHDYPGRPTYAWQACPNECGYELCPHVADPNEDFCDCDFDCGSDNCNCDAGRACCGE